MTYPIAKISSSRDYSKSVFIHAPSQVVFRLLTTIEGLQSWWGNPVKGSPKKDGEIRFERDNAELFSIMLVDQTMPPSNVRWTVVEDTSYDGEWVGTCMVFSLKELDTLNSEMYFQHIGLTPQLKNYADCKKSWDHYIKNIVHRSEAGISW